MRSSRAAIVATSVAALQACSGGSSSGPPSGSNVVPITVNGSLCSAAPYPNKPCVSVTICSPGTSNCQTISDVLLDTGSYGLRVFKQLLTVSLPPVTVASGALAECVQYADGSSDWGPIVTADVVLGGEPAVRVPIQAVDSTYGSLPGACTNPDVSPATALFNGILGVGVFAEDCGPGCAQDAANGMYFACSGAGCTGAAVATATQVQNPVAHLTRDSNGVVVELPGVAAGGAVKVDGYLLLGIGTESNNSPSGAAAYPADDLGNIATRLGGVTYSSYLDTGSNGLFFSPPAPGITVCTSDPSWFCASPPVSLTATNSGAYGSPSGSVSFQIGDYDTMSSTNNVFPNLGGPSPTDFDWGLPFFLGRRVFFGIESRSSALGTGPYYAY